MQNKISPSSLLFNFFAMLFIILGFSATYANPLAAQTTAASLSDLQRDIAQLSTKADTEQSQLAETEKKEVKELISRASTRLEAAKQFLERHQNHERILAAGQQSMLTEQEQATIRQLEQQATESPELAVEMLHELVQEGESLSTGLNRHKANIDARLADLLLLAKSGASRINELKERLLELNLASNTSTDLPDSAIIPLTSQARLLRAQAEQNQLNAELRYLEWTTSNLATLSTQLEEDRNKAIGWKARTTQALKIVKDQLHQKRQAQTTQRVKALNANGHGAQGSPILTILQNEVTQLLTENKKRLEREQQMDDERSVLSQTVLQLTGDFERVRHLLVIGGRNERVSKILRGKRSLVNAAKRGAKPLLSYQESLNAVMFRIFDLEILLKELQQPQVFLTQKANQIPINLSETPIAEAEGYLSDYRDAGRVLLETLRRQATQLAELERLSADLSIITNRYEDFLNKTVLWLPSDSVNIVDQYHGLLPGLAHILSPDRWQDLIMTLGRHWRQHLWGLLLIIAVGITAHFKARLVSYIVRSSQIVSRPSTDQWRHSLGTVFASALVALPLALCAIILGLMITKTSTTHFDTRELGQGFLFFGFVLFGCQFLRKLLLPQGFLIKHMRWPESVAENISQTMGWLRWYLPLSLLFGQIALASPQQDGAIAISRLIFITSLVFVLIGLYRLFRSEGAVLNHLKSNAPSHWVAYHPVWFPALLFVPITLFVGVIAGYYYTTIYIAEKLMFTTALIIGLALIRALCIRYLFVIKRRYRYQELLASQLARQAEANQTNQNSETASNAEETKPAEEELEIDFKTLSYQAESLVRMGFWLTLLLVLGWVWTDLFIAVTELDQLISGTDVGTVAAEATFTFGSVLTALLIGGFAIFMARNLPGLLELVVLQRLPLIAGTKYAITTIVQYIIVLVGIVAVSRVFGIEWSNIQWLVAALSVGLGFGLQEIVANFISGIILLFEQPIRVGDIITINGVSGTVSRIRIRATTIINWDKQEFIMPNKTFITGELTNWTLTDTLNRLVFNIGLAYGSDVKKAMAILEAVAQEHPAVVEDPATLVTFDDFGDNALLICARMYLANLDNRLVTRTEINLEIDRRFKEAGIIIAYPQRDIHLDVTKPVEISILDTHRKHAELNT